MDWTPEELQAIVDEHALVLFMKGTPTSTVWLFKCAAQVMQALGEPFAAVNILTDPRAIPSVCTCQTSRPCHKSCSWRINWWIRHCT